MKLRVISALALLSTIALAEPAAVVSKVIGKASAPASTQLPAGSQFTTGARSKSEIAMKKGVVRVGENADLQTTTSGLVLRQGVTVVASQPGTFRSTIDVRAPGYRLKVKGTAQISFDPGRSLKVVVLEGSITISLDSLAGELETLRPGQMLVINPSDNRLPEPVEVNIERLVATSKLTSGELGELPTAGNIKAATAGQGIDLTRGELASTPFLLRGTDTELQLRQIKQAEAAAERRAPDPAVVEQTIFRVQNDLDDPRAVTRERPFVFGNSSTTDTLDSFVFQRDANNRSRTNLLSVELTSHFSFADPDNPVADLPPRITGDVTAAASFFAGDTRTLQIVTRTTLDPAAPGTERLQIEPGAYVHTPSGVGLGFVTSQGMDVKGARLTAGKGTAAKELLSLNAANGGMTITDSSELIAGRIAIQGSGITGQQITVDHSKLTAKRNLSIGIKTSPTGIIIRNSSELASLIANLDLTANQAPITVDGASKLTAKRQLTIDAFASASENPGNTPGIVTLRDAQLMAAAIKVRAFSPSGDSLIIDGSTFNAAQFIQLYAEGASTLRFRNTVSLNTALAILAGKTVEVENGGSVNITGKGRVFTDIANYNTGSYGTIKAGGGLTTKPHAERPTFTAKPKQ